MRPARLAPRLALLQGVYYVVTGVWPLVDMRSFEHVTGPKTDHWLVKTVGVLVTVIGVTLGVGARRTASRETRVLAVASAAALAGVDVSFSARGRISRIYLLDAVAEIALVVGWILATRRRATAMPRTARHRAA